MREFTDGDGLGFCLHFVELCRSDFGLELIVDCLFLISVGLELPESWGAAGHGRESEGGTFGEGGGASRQLKRGFAWGQKAESPAQEPQAKP